MSVFNMIFFPVVLLAVLLVQCIDEPDVILGGEPVKATIRGTVKPCPSPTTVFLIGVEDGDTVAVTEALAPDGEFVFKEVGYDHYTVSAVRGDWCIQQEIRVREPSVIVPLLYGAMPPHFARFGIPITPAQLINDSLLRLGLDHKHYSIILESVELTPTNLHENTKIRQNIRNEQITLDVVIDTLFALDTFWLSFRYESMLECNEGAVYTAAVSVPIDSSGLDSAITALLVKLLGSYSVNSEHFHPQHWAPDTVGIGPEDHLGIVFAQHVDMRNIQDAVSITPSVGLDYFRYGDTLRVVPANRLSADSTYYITIDPRVAPFRTALRFPVTVSEESTSFFRTHWPLNGTQDAPVDLSFAFVSNYSLEPELLEGAFTIVPDVDSLRFVSSASGAVKVYHAPLDPGVTYRITVDQTCRSRKGTALEEPVTIEFTTESDS